MPRFVPGVSEPGTAWARSSMRRIDGWPRRQSGYRFPSWRTTRSSRTSRTSNIGMTPNPHCVRGVRFLGLVAARWAGSRGWGRGRSCPSGPHHRRPGHHQDRASHQCRPRPTCPAVGRPTPGRTPSWPVPPRSLGGYHAALAAPPANPAADPVPIGVLILLWAGENETSAVDVGGHPLAIQTSGVWT